MEATKSEKEIFGNLIIPLIGGEEVKRTNVPLYESQRQYLFAYGEKRGIRNNLAATIGLILGDFFEANGFYSNDFRKSFYILKQYKDERLNHQVSKRICEANKGDSNAKEKEVKSRNSGTIDGKNPKTDK